MHIPFSITFGKQPLIKFKGFSNIRQSIIIPSPSQTLYFIQCSSIIKFKTQKNPSSFITAKLGGFLICINSGNRAISRPIKNSHRSKFVAVALILPQMSWRLHIAPEYLKVFESPTGTLNWQLPTVTLKFQSPTVILNWQLPTVTLKFQSPTVPLNWKLPTVTLKFQSPTVTLNQANFFCFQKCARRRRPSSLSFSLI